MEKEDRRGDLCPLYTHIGIFCPTETPNTLCSIFIQPFTHSHKKTHTFPTLTADSPCSWAVPPGGNLRISILPVDTSTYDRISLESSHWPHSWRTTVLLSELFCVNVYATLDMDKRKKGRGLPDEIRKTCFDLQSTTTTAALSRFMFLWL